jgi:carboxyl-terminal processing protease
VNYAQKLENMKTITINDAILQDFRDYLKEKDFSFQTEGEEEIQQLQKISAKNQYGPAFSKNLEELNHAVEEIKKSEFNKHKDFIRKYLKRELAAKLLGSKGQVEATFEDDPVLQTGLDVLANPKEYALKLGK